ncbi:MAG: hypothetical protein JSU63_05710 [Phycisphaerales bacterium]|nr:MAG: hypothetical protein JSU63_05710 [Phycisphaerales bacterium]
MTDPTTPSDHRAQHVAAVGFVLQTAAFATLLWASLWTQSDAITTVARFVLAGIPIWLVLYLVFNQLRRVRAEELETAELKRTRQAGASTAIFELDDEELLLEQHRLTWMIRWLLPATTVIVSAFLLLGHFIFWGWALDLEVVFGPEGLRRASEPTVVMWFVVGVGFFCFLFARYAIALARMPDWRLLRAGASYMAGNALACLLLAIALMATSTVEWAEPLLAVLVRVVMIVLGLELAVNFLMDFYRPRTPDVAQRPSFDSRLLGLTSDPGGIAKSIADAVNYQFGFEVSSTWFYQLLQRWMLPIMVVTVLVILGMTSIVIVDAEELAVKERFGSLVSRPQTVLEPGLHFKLPYPIDVVRRAPAKRIDELIVGEATQNESDADAHKAIVWTESHKFVPELMLLVAAKKEGDEGKGEDLTFDDDYTIGTSVPVGMLMVSVPIEYRIKDIEKYLYKYDDPIKLMEGVAYRHLSDYAASVDIDELMGPGREAFNRGLQKHIQHRLDELDVGIEIVFVGVRGAHPPAERKVAEAFQSAVSALTSKAATINAAEGEARRILTTVVGTEARAIAFDMAIRHRDQLRSTADADPQALAEAGQRVEDLLTGNSAKGIAPPSGEVAVMIAQARSAASDLLTDAVTKVRAFSAEVTAFEAAPKLYRQRKIISVYSALSAIRKYFIIGNPESVIVEFQSGEQAGLDRVLSDGLEGNK